MANGEALVSGEMRVIISMMRADAAKAKKRETTAPSQRANLPIKTVPVDAAEFLDTADGQEAYLSECWPMAIRPAWPRHERPWRVRAARPRRQPGWTPRRPNAPRKSWVLRPVTHSPATAER